MSPDAPVGRPEAIVREFMEVIAEPAPAAPTTPESAPEQLALPEQVAAVPEQVAAVLVEYDL